MRKTLTRLKEGAKNLFSRICRHETCLYIAVFAFCLITVLFVRSEIKHTAEVLKIQKEKAVLINHIQDLNKLSQEKNTFIDIQHDILRKQSDELRGAGDIIREQGTMLNRLIQYLKDIKEWPPKIKPTDPDKWI